MMGIVTTAQHCEGQFTDLAKACQILNNPFSFTLVKRKTYQDVM